MELPRVTEILKSFGLIQYEWAEPKHLRRGRLVDACANILGAGGHIEDDWLNQHSGEAGNDRVDHGELCPYLDAYEKFLSETGFKMADCAVEVKSVHGFIGHLDQLGVFANSETPVLIDIKTGAESPWHPLQLALYKVGVAETLRFIPTRWNLYLNPEGYKLVPRPKVRDITEALSLVAAYHVIQKYKGA